MKDDWDGDRDPLSALRRGDPALFEAFVRSESRTFLGFFLRLGAGPEEAEDLVQDLLLKLFQHATDYQHEGKFTGFAFRVARNAWIDRVRRGRVRGRGSAAGDEPGHDVDQIPAARVDPSQHAQAREAQHGIHAAWTSLSEPHRLVFELGVLQDRSYQEISETLDIPVGTVKSRMFYALRKLREALAPPCSRGGRHER